MPDYDGNGPRKMGRLIGRGRGPCRDDTADCQQKRKESFTADLPGSAEPGKSE